MKGLGKGVRLFKDGMNNIEKDIVVSDDVPTDVEKEVKMDNDKQSFWDHLDVLRAAIIKIVAVTVIFGVLAFFLRNNCFPLSLLQKTRIYYLSVV